MLSVVYVHVRVHVCVLVKKLGYYSHNYVIQHGFQLLVSAELNFAFKKFIPNHSPCVCVVVFFLGGDFVHVCPVCVLFLF